LPLDDRIQLVSDVEFLIFYIAVINIISFFVCVYDKRMAKKDGWRISEKTLWILSLLGGAFAMLFAMKLVRHKTKHTSFVIGMPAILIAHISIAAAVIILL